MDILQSIILGLIQGLTEFLPISSSGHLVLGGALFDLESEDITFEVFLHFATFLAVFVFFFRQILKIIISPVRYVFAGSRGNEDLYWSKYALLIAIGTIPAVIVGLFMKDQIERAFSSVFLTGLMLLVTTAVLFLTLLARPHRSDLKARDGILVGIAQAVAILPGISRSGSTISTAMFLGVDKKTAFNFSFLLSLPAIFGAFLLQLKDALDASIQWGEILTYIPGMVVALVSGYVSLIVLRRIVIAGKFAYFGIYTLIIAILAIIFSHA
ncbi:MAG: undecaprenyl-diphosphate phosphatase [candidate division Zixibacteria bacterium]|nr:undecaprenyl-diphosphate phosphatase [candidate division Zixibacteria bacterium]NIR66430.1 undecaprenyl-diphosphate phosphatase [candidate division Zixibacteria bacterium]NIS18074.1 undecaprenyl-diphosphate phosphatase [candidate division Zixibacteria bacterium]NIS48020.1 undecaprenyl-diphosphate phosphatase [candidate division Zixibacteria bacterium]NIT54354.1 undecaprenyl-diphosphate phosphatase [candidate division Zixibacteria bacterium]